MDGSFLNGSVNQHLLPLLCLVLGKCLLVLHFGHVIEVYFINRVCRFAVLAPVVVLMAYIVYLLQGAMLHQLIEAASVEHVVRISSFHKTLSHNIYISLKIVCINIEVACASLLCLVLFLFFLFYRHLFHFL